MRQISSPYPLANVYNTDESGLFYLMGPRNSYLPPPVKSLKARGTELQKQKARKTILMSANSNASHTIPVGYIGLAAQSRCFRDKMFVHYKENYASQKNAWMDGEKFKEWIMWWYKEVCRKTIDNIFRIVDNCGGQESNLGLTGFRIGILPPNTTSKYRTFDVGLIAHSKIRYWSILLK